MLSTIQALSVILLSLTIILTRTKTTAALIYAAYSAAYSTPKPIHTLTCYTYSPHTNITFIRTLSTVSAISLSCDSYLYSAPIETENMKSVFSKCMSISQPPNGIIKCDSYLASQSPNGTIKCDVYSPPSTLACLSQPIFDVILCGNELIHLASTRPLTYSAPQTDALTFNGTYSSLHEAGAPPNGILTCGVYLFIHGAGAYVPYSYSSPTSIHAYINTWYIFVNTNTLCLWYWNNFYTDALPSLNKYTFVSLHIAIAIARVTDEPLLNFKCIVCKFNCIQRSIIIGSLAFELDALLNKYSFNNSIRNLQRKSSLFKSTLNICNLHSNLNGKQYFTHSNVDSHSQSTTNKLKSRSYSLPTAPTHKLQSINGSKQNGVHHYSDVHSESNIIQPITH